MKMERNGLLRGTLIAFSIMVFASIGILMSSFYLLKVHVEVSIWREYIIVCMMLLSLAMAVLIIWVYRPILKLHKALLRLHEGRNGLELNLQMSIDSVANTIDRLLNELEMSMEREHAVTMLQQQSQYAELQNQINPHFLYNTLETIRGQAMIDENYKIADMTETLAKCFRYNISKNNDSVTVRQELENVRNYIKIQQYRFQDRFVFQVYEHCRADEYEDCLIPKMTLQPIVENAVYHGLEKKMGIGHISIHIESTVEKLNILVSDDGIGMREETVRQLNEKFAGVRTELKQPERGHHNGIAMENVNERLKLLYGKEFGLHISSMINLGTEVEITLPRNSKKEEHQTL